MGVTLPKPLMTKVEERDGNSLFRVGSSCVNGFRENMEDAHIVLLRDTWAFFGIFDGHVNEHCSAYLETAFKNYLEKNPGPMSDERMRQMALEIDQQWLETGSDGGSTGTFFLASKGVGRDTITLQVGNVGDSRVLVRKNGNFNAMTEDHKPSVEAERARIEAAGGRVENNRVDGSLAISRAFGDRDYKQSPDEGELNQKVIALADVARINVLHTATPSDKGDFAVLCCDGVFESNFSSEEVVAFVGEKLKGEQDLATVAGLVCEEAISRGSRDNISCMVVQFTDGSDLAAEQHLLCNPGPFNGSKSTPFVKMYKEMARRGGMEVGKALEIRYDAIKAGRAEADDDEQQAFGNGPEASLTGERRTEWFTNLHESLLNKPPGQSRSDNLARFAALQQQVGLPLPVLLALMGENADLGV